MINKALHIVTSDTNTTIGFKIHTSFLTVIKGVLNGISGFVDWHEDAPEDGALHITTKTTSLKTDLAERDSLFKSADHLNVWEFDHLELNAKGFKQVGEAYVSNAALKIKGIVRTLQLKLIHNKQEEQFEGSLKFNRFDYTLGIESNFYKDIIHANFTIKMT